MAKTLSSVDCCYVQNFTYSTYLHCLYYLLLKITSNLCQLNDGETQLKNSEEIIIGVVNCYKIGIKPFKQTPLDDELTAKFIGNINALGNIIANLQMIACDQEKEIYSIFKELLGCVFTLIANNAQPNQDKFEKVLNVFLQKTPTAKLFRTLFLIQADSKMSVNDQKTIHKYLTKCLYLSNGFIALCEALLGVHKEENVREKWHSCTVIANIVSRRGHPIRFYKSVIERIHSIFMRYADNDSSIREPYVEAGVHTMTKLHSLNNEMISSQIEHAILGPLNNIISPEDLLNGTILLEEHEFKRIIKIIYMVFCATGPSDVTLPSQVLVSYLPLFLQLYSVSMNVQDQTVQREIQSVLVRCLSNREKGELNQIVEKLMFENFSPDMKTIHPTVCLNQIQVNDRMKTFSLKISNTDDSPTDTAIIQNYDVSSALVDVLKASNHNILIYNVFVHLLHLLALLFVSNDSSQRNIDLFRDVDDMMEFMKKNFKHKYSVLNALNELLVHKPLYNQINSNPTEILDLLHNIIKDASKQLQTDKSANEQLEQILMMVLSILDEVCYKIKDNNDQTVSCLMQTLNELREILTGRSGFDVIIMKLDAILQPENGNKNPEYVKAFKILSEQSEPYSRVYAIRTISDLLDKRDDEAIANAYSILALSLKVLKDKDSYVFLNCIKLLVSLTKVLESPVLDALVAEYQLQGDDEKEVDYKLKLGEAIIKMTESLGKFRGFSEILVITEDLRKKSRKFIEVLRRLTKLCELLRNF